MLVQFFHMIINTPLIETGIFWCIHLYYRLQRALDCIVF